MNAHTAGEISGTLRTAVEAAVWAPSTHNTQPWSFAVSGNEISLRADPDRKLRLADTTGRQMLISCGAALFNVRIALRALGYEPEVRRFPDPDRSLLLATIRARRGVEADEQTMSLYGEIERRRTHRAGFTTARVREQVTEMLMAQASTEGARLMPVRSQVEARVLAALTSAAQDVQSQDRMIGLELIRWARPPGSTRRDGVPAHSYPLTQRRTYPQHFAQRDYAWGHSWGSETEQRRSTATGLVAVLTTRADTRHDWLAAGEALQRTLLRASACGLSAAFHTQALEMPELREFIRNHLCSGEHPQMIMRLGFVRDGTGSVRRPCSEVLEER
ncbi:hypothetical protein AB0O34_08245 [Sphaerisporangium sp. NPDC088356]|uniref:Acg family FMN-binding oxidoreductase n=1 Tax=Sphaerisporangium sp. NPDC088356 TaxID=3154871 RepID=UPI00341E8FB0